MVNAAVSSTISERLEEPRHIAPERLRLTPARGTTTINDRLPQGKFPSEPFPALAPDLVVDVFADLDPGRE